jgi:ABC-type sulfate transport system permease subunit
MFKAYIGMSFSIAFLIGPMIGAYFSMETKTTGNSSSNFNTKPAHLAIALSLLVLVIAVVFLSETRLDKKEVRI